MDYFNELLKNYVLLTAICGWAAAQIIKTIIDLLLTKKLTLERLVGSGGMPSSHSSTVCSLATATALQYGLGSIEFALAAVLAIIVMYDARGVRRETGTQAVVLNQIMDFLTAEHPEQIRFTQENLKELVGHTPLQVVMGAILGIAIGFASFEFFF